MSNKIQQYYDETAEFYQNVGVNDRNYKIHELLLRFGLQRKHNVLEIGCGIGVQTQLLAKYLSSNTSITAIDLSPKSIALAKIRFSKYKNIKWIATDVFDGDFTEQFDVIVLPDVLQYIPLEKHSSLFEKLRLWLSPKGIIFIHFPTSNFVAWSKINDISKLNIDDIEISDSHIMNCATKAKFEIQAFEKYSLWHKSNDYQYIVLKHQLNAPDFDNRKLSFFQKIKKHIVFNFLKIQNILK